MKHLNQIKRRGVHMEGVLTKIPEVRLGSIVCEDIMGSTQSQLLKKGQR